MQSGAISQVDHPAGRNHALLRRAGKGHSAPLKLLGVMRRAVNINPRLDAVGIVRASVATHYGPIYERLLAKLWAAGRV